MERHQGHYSIADTDMRELSLHEVTGSYGVEGLRQQFLQYVDDLDIKIDDKQSIVLALEVGSIVHQGQKRGIHPYLTHLIRVSSRIINHFGVTDPDIIKAAILHDSVEDQPGKFVDGVSNDHTENPFYQKQALERITKMFGDNVSTLVAGVTNPQFDKDKDTATQYRQHVADAMTENPQVRIIKMSDFLDNCKGLNHNELPAPRIKCLAHKYYPLIPVMMDFARDETTPLSEAGRDYVISSLEKASERCQEIMAKEL